MRVALDAEGIELSSSGSSGDGRHGVFCLSEFNDSVLCQVKEARDRSQAPVLAILTGPNTLSSTSMWQLLSAGAADILSWRDPPTARRQVRAKLERWTAVEELANSVATTSQMVGVSVGWKALVRKVIEAAHFSLSPILLIGDSGTGKELLARLAHRMHPNPATEKLASDPVTLDCSTIVPELSGSELFGHERGAYTGAISPREGAFALADGSTLFLDEIGELPAALQTQLLRAIQEGTYKKVGGNVWQSTDFRLVSATNRNLGQLVETGKFRLDLYHRIAGWVFTVPPLSERREDILPLALNFLHGFRKHEEPIDFDPAVSEYLLNREYPGNVRELRQLVQRITYRHVGPGPITIGDVPPDDRPSIEVQERAWPNQKFEDAVAEAVTMGRGLKDIARAANDTAVRVAVRSEHGNLQSAARRLGITDRALQIRRASGKIQA